MTARLSAVTAMWRSGWRIQRFELVTVLLLGAAAAAAATYVAFRLAGIAPPADCLSDYLDSGVSRQGCPSIRPFIELRNDLSGKVLGPLVVLPVFLGLIPGASLVAGEIEHRTAQLSWMLMPLRRRWLLSRLLPLAVVVLVASAVAAIAAEILVGEAVPWLDSRSSFTDYGARGPVFVSRAVAFASVGLLVGAVVGRQIPALVISVLACLGLLLLLTVSRPFGEPVVTTPGHRYAEGSLGVGAGYRADDGSFLTAQDSEKRAPAGMTEDQAQDWVDETFDPVTLSVPGERLAAVELRESAVLLVISGAAGAATMIVIERRRPY